MATIEETKARRKLQQQMMANALQQPAYINPGEPPAKAWQPVIQMLGGMIQGKRLEGQEKEAQANYQKTLADALSPNKSPAITLPPDQEGPVRPEIQTPKTYEESSSILMQNPDTADFGMQYLLQGLKRKEDAAARQQTLTAEQDFRRTENEANRKNLRDIAGMNITGRQSVAETSAAARGKPNSQTAQKIKAKQSQISALKMQLQKVKEAFEGKADESGKITGGLKNSFSAGLGTGILPTESGREFDRTVALMSPLARQITRTPGEGAMSDYESRLVQMGLPSRNEHESVTAKQIADWEDLINVLEQGYAGLTPEQQVEQPGMLPVQKPSGGRIRFDANGNRIP